MLSKLFTVTYFYYSGELIFFLREETKQATSLYIFVDSIRMRFGYLKNCLLKVNYFSRFLEKQRNAQMLDATCDTRARGRLV